MTPTRPARAQRRLFAWLALTALSALAGCSVIEPQRSVNTAALDAELAAIVADPAHPLASLSVLAIKDGRVAYEGQFGRRHIDPADRGRDLPANAATMYRIASISKLITTLGVMRMVDEGRLSLDRDIGDYLGYPVRNPAFPDVPVTLRMLLSHTSSLRDDAGYYWEAKLGVDLRDVLVPGGRLHASGAMWAKEAAPGKYFQYCNFAWGVIGTVMEKVAGERFDRLMRRLVLDPLALRGGFHPADFSPADLRDTATLYRKRRDANGQETWDPAGPWVAQVDDYTRDAPVARAGKDYVPGTNGTLFGPQGNCRLSAAGLARVMRMLMDDGRLDGKEFLTPGSIVEMMRTQWRANDAGDAAASGQPANGNTRFGSHYRLFNEWGLGNQHFLDIGARHADKAGERGAGDRLAEGGGLTGVGHLGDAWGLTSGFILDKTNRRGLIFLIGGPGFDPETWPGTYSAFYRHEEKLMTAIYRRVLQSN